MLFPMGSVNSYNAMHGVFRSNRKITRLIPLTNLPLHKNGHHFADDIFRCIFINEKCILIEISLKFVPKGPIGNNPALV